MATIKEEKEMKLTCMDCETKFNCEKGKELRTNCPNCGSGNVIIAMEICNHSTLQKRLK